MVLLCEPRGDRAPEVTPLGRVGIEPWGGDPAQWVVRGNGAGVDLAYTHVPVGSTGEAVNLALLLGIDGVEGVSGVVAVRE